MSLSLFGGDRGNGLPAEESDIAESSPAESQLGDSDADAISGVQLPQGAHKTAEQIDADINTSDSEYVDEDSDAEDVDDRPNRYSGPASTWRQWTANERQLAASLDQLRAGDLSVHLYNAHALKRRFRSAHQSTPVAQWQRKENWTDPANREEWIPPKSWTAWPLEPDLVPRPEERFAPPLEEDGEYVIKQDRDWKPSGDMEDLLMGIMLRTAKRQWEARDWAGDETSMPDKEQLKSESPARGRRSKSASTRRSSEAGARSRRSSSRASTAQASTAASESAGQTNGSDDEDISDNAEEPESPALLPVVMADDERASRILKPTVRSLLTKLDGLLMGLYHVRGNHLDVDSDTTASAAQTDAEDASSADSEAPTCSQGKDGLHKIVDPGHTALNLLVQESVGFQQRDSQGKNRKTSKQSSNIAGRPSDSTQQPSKPTKTNSQGASAKETPSSRSRSPTRRRRKRSRSAVSDASSSATEEWRAPMDWSEVLGTASLTGWDTAVIDRAAKRCADLFGEGISFRTLIEGEGSSTGAETTHYLPGMISAVDRASGVHAGVATVQNTGSGLDLENLVCPHPTCPRHTEAFPLQRRLAEHIRRVHKYDPYAEGSAIGDMYGGVHVDGFLQPIHARQGWRGKDTGARKKNKAKATPEVHEIE